jgi:iron(III) transport system ATP-binding protein
MAILRVENISAQIKGGPALIINSLGFEVDTGEIFALIGPSGAGKTTTLRLIAGFEQPFQGRIVFDGRVLEDLGVHVPPERRGIGFVFQDLALFPHLSVMENVTFGLNRLPKGRRKSRALEMLEAVRLEGMGHRRPHELSGGEQQRVALARAMAPSPRLVLLDEPFANLDPSLRDDVRAGVREILKSERMTAVLVTHDHSEAMIVAERIGVMRAGHLEQVGVPRELYQQPATTFVSEFLGRKSIFRTVSSDERASGRVGPPYDHHRREGGG